MATAKKISKFEELRRRAQSRRDEQVNEYELYGVEDGFDPPIVVKRMGLLELEKSIRVADENPLDAFRVILGFDNYHRIVEELGENADIETLADITNDVQAFFYGPGASESPGGSKAS